MRVLILIMLMFSLCACGDALDERNKRAQRQRAEYNKDYRARLKGALRDVNPNLSVEKRCAMVKQVMFSGKHWCDVNRHAGCGDSQFAVQVACELALGRSNGDG